MMFDFVIKQRATQSISLVFFLLPSYIFQILLLVQSIPIASLLASVITMVLLSRTNEVTAMRAVGMGPLRVGMPVALGGGLCLLSPHFLARLFFRLYEKFALHSRSIGKCQLVKLIKM